MTEAEIQIRLTRWLYDKSFCLIPNCYEVHCDESDLFQIKKSGLTVNYEIKLSVNDFRADFKHKNFHNYMRPRWRERFIGDEFIGHFHRAVPNYFYFVFPEFLYPFKSKYLDNDYFGIVTIGSSIEIVKKAPKLSKVNRYSKIAKSSIEGRHESYSLVRSLNLAHWKSLGLYKTEKQIQDSKTVEVR